LVLLVKHLLQRWSQSFRHVGISGITEDHVEYLFVTLAPKGSKKDDDWDVLPDFWDGCVNMASFLSLLNVELELQSWFVSLLILRSNLGIPAILTVRKLIIENKNDVTSLPLLCNDDLLRAINNEVTALIIHTLFLLHDS
jgi:hypothetical protein